MEHYSIKITGIVQGVWFRVSTRNQAKALGLKGFVRNEPDESVYVEVEGEEQVLDAFVKWCYTGSEQSKVDKVAVQKGALKGFEEFTITD